MTERRNLNRRENDARDRDVLIAAKFLQQWGGRLIVAYLILLTVAVIGIFLVQSQTTDNEARLRASNLRICHRLNILRAGDNVSHLVEWTVLSRFSRIDSGLSHRLTWVPLTSSCVYAVDHAGTFRAPSQVHFYRALPTAKDLQVGKGE